MWALALGAVLAVQWVQRPEGPAQGATLRAPSSAPVWDAPAEPAGAQDAPSRTALEVEPAAEGRAALYRGDRRQPGRSAYRGATAPVVRFRHPTGGRIVAQPVVASSGRIYAVSLDGKLYVLYARG